MRSTRAGSRRDDSGLIVLGWITKLVLTMAVLGLVVFDGFSLVAAKFSAADRATTYASAAADTYAHLKDIDKTYAAIVAQASENGDTVDIKTFTVAPNGQATLTISHTAKTIWLDKVGFLKKYATVTETGTGTPP